MLTAVKWNCKAWTNFEVSARWRGFLPHRRSNRCFANPQSSQHHSSQTGAEMQTLSLSFNISIGWCVAFSKKLYVVCYTRSCYLTTLIVSTCGQTDASCGTMTNIDLHLVPSAWNPVMKHVVFVEYDVFHDVPQRAVNLHKHHMFSRKTFYFYIARYVPWTS